jgi:hypothetical protein
MLKLKNNTKSQSKIGYLVAIDPSDPSSFIYAVPNSSKVLGVITESVPYRSLCTIATIGETAKVYVVGNCLKNDILRGTKSNDRVSLGACTIAKSGDAPYLKVGDALHSGNGLVSCVLELSYSSSVSTSTFLGEEFETVSKNLKNYPYTLTYGVDGLATIVYDLGGGLSITKTFNYTLTVLTSIVLSGDTPTGIELTKTLSYTGADLTSVAYS